MFMSALSFCLRDKQPALPYTFGALSLRLSRVYIVSIHTLRY
ncbi:hypothetical protein ANACAC_00446 [Anaerostipes caccae L1-92]|uniref:Uncharacterized protein n=1 Tax=Anaerostipes caccae (strain DSM 14662 / CCUG 47493 / JCM 13470 / NCIMB 13811 / L1-92) TaxID=411490 RepID=B0MA72_ANACD|nr:hypothetical protein ANACAC_00446 [Anaerostipes caccae L1-92]